MPRSPKITRLTAFRDLDDITIHFPYRGIIRRYERSHRQKNTCNGHRVCRAILVAAIPSIVDNYRLYGRIERSGSSENIRV